MIDHTKRRIPLFLALAAPVIFSFGAAGSFAADLSGRTDASIRTVVDLVARHQIQPLSDGDYAPVDTLKAAEAARPPRGIHWNYPWGVALYGMEASVKVTHDSSVETFVRRHDQIASRYYAWLEMEKKKLGGKPGWRDFVNKTSLRQLMVLGKLDNCGAMGVAMLEQMKDYPDTVTADEKRVVARIADWIVNKQDRMPDGTLYRAKRMGGTVWPDDLYMACPFLVRWSEYTGDKRYLDDAASQVIHQAALEQDSDGLFYHGYFVKEHKHAPYKWGRGNGWAMVATVEILSALPENDPARPKLLEILRKQIDGIKAVQAPDGMWRQILDRPDMWEETSCSAMFAYSIARAVNRGWIDRSNLVVARRAFEGICKRITPSGDVNGTCQGTGIGLTLKFYRTRKRPENDPHGRGPVMLAGTEILKADGK